jgi:hypothetical protein
LLERQTQRFGQRRLADAHGHAAGADAAAHLDIDGIGSVRGGFGGWNLG